MKKYKDQKTFWAQMGLFLMGIVGSLAAFRKGDIKLAVLNIVVAVILATALSWAEDKLLK